MWALPHVYHVSQKQCCQIPRLRKIWTRLPFLTVKDNMVLNPIFGKLTSRAIQNIPDMIGHLQWLKS